MNEHAIDCVHVPGQGSGLLAEVVRQVSANPSEDSWAVASKVALDDLLARPNMPSSSSYPMKVWEYLSFISGGFTRVCCPRVSVIAKALSKGDVGSPDRVKLALRWLEQNGYIARSSVVTPGATRGVAWYSPHALFLLRPRLAGWSPSQVPTECPTKMVLAVQSLTVKFKATSEIAPCPLRGQKDSITMELAERLAEASGTEVKPDVVHVRKAPVKPPQLVSEASVPTTPATKKTSAPVEQVQKPKLVLVKSEMTQDMKDIRAIAESSIPDLPAWNARAMSSLADDIRKNGASKVKEVYQWVHEHWSEYVELGIADGLPNPGWIASRCGGRVTADMKSGKVTARGHHGADRAHRVRRSEWYGDSSTGASNPASWGLD